MKTAWLERAKLFWEEKVAGVPAAWGKGGDRRLPGGSEPDEKGLKSSVDSFWKARGEPQKDFKQGPG